MPAPALPLDYQLIFHALPENFLLIGADPDATILDNTDSHVAVSLKARESVVGKPFFEAFPATDASGAAEIRASHDYVRQHLAPHTMPLIRYDLTGPDGLVEDLYWQATHYPVLDASGQLRYILQRTQNVTKQRRAALAAAETQRQLDAEQQRTRFILQSLPVLVWTATPDGQRDYFNPRWLDFTGQELASQLGEGWLAGLHPDDQQRVHEQWRQSVAAGTPYQVEYRLRRADGEYRWVLSRATPQHDEAGHVRLWVGGVVEVHDQKMMVQELLDTNEQQAALSEQSYQHYQQAQQQRQNFFNLFMSAPAHISIVRGPEHRYEFANHEFVKLVGNRSLEGRTVAEAFPETVSQGVVALLDEVYRTGKPFYGHEAPFQLTGDDGQLHEVYLNFVYQRFEENGQPAGITSYSTDVTELVRARQALARQGAAGTTEASEAGN